MPQRIFSRALEGVHRLALLDEDKCGHRLYRVLLRRLSAGEDTERGSERNWARSSLERRCFKTGSDVTSKGGGEVQQIEHKPFPDNHHSNPRQSPVVIHVHFEKNCLREVLRHRRKRRCDLFAFRHTSAVKGDDSTKAETEKRALVSGDVSDYGRDDTICLKKNCLS